MTVRAEARVDAYGPDGRAFADTSTPKRCSSMWVTHAAVDEGKDVRKRKGLRSVNPVTPRRRSGAADRIRTGDVQLGKLAFCH